MRLAYMLVAALLSVGCGAEGRGPAHIRAPEKARLAPAVRAVAAIGGRDAVFLPDGRVARPVGRSLHVFDPANPDVGELLPFEGILEVAGKHVFKIVLGDTHRLVELDARFHELHSVEISTPIGATTDDGEYFVAARRGRFTLFRTRDFAPLLEGLSIMPAAGRLWGRLGTSVDRRYLVTARDVVDLEKGKVVFSHDALLESAYLVDKGRLHWAFRDLLETVELATGARARTWLPCRGPSATDAAAATLYTACSASVLRTVFDVGALKSDSLPIDGALEVARPLVDEEGRLVVSTYEPSPTMGATKYGPSFIMARGASKLHPEATLVAGQTHPGPRAATLRLTNGKMVSLGSLDTPAKVSPDRRFALVGRELVSLENGARLTLPTLDMGIVDLTVRDGAVLLSKHGESGKILHELRLAPSLAPGPREHVSIKHEEPRPDADPTWTVTVEDEKGARTASFSTTSPADVGEPWGAGVLLRRDGALDEGFAYCTRAGKCQNVRAEGGLVGLGQTFAFRARADASALTIEQLGAGPEKSLELGAHIAFATATADGVYAVIGEKPRRLVHVSVNEMRVTREVALDAIDGALVGAVGNTLVFSDGPIVRYYDAASLAPKGLVVYSEKGYVHVREDGRYTLHGDTSDVLPAILCTSGDQVLRRTRCESESGMSPSK